MNSSKWAVVASVIGAVALAGMGRLAAQDAGALQASVGQVTDNRSTGSFFSECKVELKFTGDAAADSGSVRHVKVAKAVDELGRDLIPKKEDSDGFDNFSSSHGGTLKAEVKLRNPSRKAATIKLIEGEAELFNPTEANGGIVVIKDALKTPGEPIQNPALKKLGIEIIYMTKESYEAKKKAAEKNEAGGKLGEAFGEMFKGMFSGMMMSDAKDSLRFFISDKDKRLVEIDYLAGNGKPLKTRGGMSSGNFRQRDLEAPPPADTQLKLLLAVPAAVKTFPFKVENIPLP